MKNRRGRQKKVPYFFSKHAPFKALFRGTTPELSAVRLEKFKGPPMPVLRVTELIRCDSMRAKLNVSRFFRLLHKTSKKVAMSPVKMAVVCLDLARSLSPSFCSLFSNN